MNVIPQRIQPAESSAAPSRAEIIRAVAEVTGFSLRELIGYGRHTELARARQLICYLGTKVYGYSQPMIAHRLGDRDHTTIRWGAIRIADELRWGNESVSANLAKARELIEGRPIEPQAPPPPPEPQPEPEPFDAEAAAALHAEIKSLRAKGWSIKGLAKRHDMDPADVASVVGEFWPGRHTLTRTELAEISA